MAWVRTGLTLLAAASLALAGCSKNNGSAVTAAASPSAAPAQAFAAVPTPSPVAMNQALDFGDDTGKYARDGECDDPRFAGAGMTNTPLLASDIRHDATDCRSAFEQGRLSFKGDAPTPQPAAYDPDSAVDRIIWGDDSGKYARDGECDDKRFTGAGMTDTPLLDSDIKHDASDCRTAFAQGRLTLR